MQITLFDQDPVTTAAMALAFQDLVTKGDVQITTIENDRDLGSYDYVVYPGNSFGALLSIADDSMRTEIQDTIQDVIMQNFPFGMPVGEMVILSIPDFLWKGLIYAPIMRTLSQVRTLDAAYVMSIVVHYILQHPDKTVAIPCLGVGEGSLPPEAAAAAMRAGYDTGFYIFSGSRCGE